MTRDDARELSARGMEVASHGLTHPDLRKLDDAALDAELRDSRAAIEEVTGRPCRTFAYPFGLFDARAKERVGAAGYELALAWGRGAVGPARGRPPPRPTAPRRLPARAQAARGPDPRALATSRSAVNRRALSGAGESRSRVHCAPASPAARAPAGSSR